jgi:hypothetical protein
MSEEAVVDNAEPVEDNSAPTEQNTSIEKFGQFIDQYVPEEYKDAKTWDKFRDTDPATALKSIADMDKYIGKKGDIPAEDATEEARAEFWNKLGADKIEVDLPELGEEFGDLKGELSEYYGGINEQIMEIAKEVIPSAKNVPDIIQGILSKFVQNDAKATLDARIQAQAAEKEALGAAAQRLGVTTEEMTRVNNELIQREGNDVTFHELAYKYAQATSNSATPKDALVSTPAGKQSRMQEIYEDRDFWNKTPENAKRHDQLVAEHRKLFDELNESA